MLEIAPDADSPGVMILGVFFLSCLFGCFAAWTLLATRLAMRQPILPKRPWPRVSWTGAAVAGSIGAWLALNLAVVSVFRLLRRGDDPITSLDQMAAISVINLILMVSLPLFLRIWTDRPLRQLGVPGPNWLGDALLGSLGAFVLAPIVFLVLLLCALIWKPRDHPLKDMVLGDGSGLTLSLAFVAAVILAPIVEELMFRGILQGWLERRAFRPRPVPAPEPVPTLAGSSIPESPLEPIDDPDNPYASPRTRPASPVIEPDALEAPSPTSPAALFALLFPAVLFAGVHSAQWPAPIPLLVLALGLGFLYRRTGGLVAPIAMHATFNSFSTIALLLASYFDLIPPEMLK